MKIHHGTELYVGDKTPQMVHHTPVKAAVILVLGAKNHVEVTSYHPGAVHGHARILKLGKELELARVILGPVDTGQLTMPISRSW